MKAKVKVGVEPEMTRVIRASSDASADYFIPKSRAVELWHEGKLQYDVMNKAYCHKDSNALQPRLK